MRLTLLCQAASARTRDGGFPAPGDPIDPREHARIERLTVPGATMCFTAPETVALDTAARLGLVARPADALREADHGAWAGRSFADVADTSAAPFAVWLARPWTAPPGGEAFADVIGRVAPWVDGSEREAGVLAIAGVTVIRAVLCHAIGLSPEAAMRVDVAPLSRVVLSRTRGWRLQALGA